MTLAFICVSSSGCYYRSKDVAFDDPFRIIYYRSAPSKHDTAGNRPSVPSEVITLSCVEMPLSTLCRVLSDKFSVGLVFSGNQSNSTITAEFKDTDFESVLNVISRQLNSEIIKIGNTYYIGSLRPEDRGILVRRILGFNDQALTQIVNSLVSTNGKATVYDSIVIVADHESVLRRISDSLDYLDSVKFDTWIVQLCFITLRADALANAGFDVVSSGTISYDVANSKLDFKDFDINALLNLSASSSLADIYASPMFVVRDGSTAKWQDGKRVPIPKKSVSDYGTVTTTGYDYVNTGFLVNCTVSAIKGGGRLNIEVELSDILSYVESAPVTSTTSYSFETDVVSGKLYMVGELSTFKLLDQQENVLDFSGERGKTSVQLWVQCYQIERSGVDLSPNLPKSY